MKKTIGIVLLTFILFTGFGVTFGFDISDNSENLLYSTEKHFELCEFDPILPPPDGNSYSGLCDHDPALPLPEGDSYNELCEHDPILPLPEGDSYSGLCDHDPVLPPPDGNSYIIV